MTRQHLITTVAKPETCPRCNTVTLAGVVEGLPARVDLAVTLDPTGEASAILAGRDTYTLLRTGELAYRDAGRIKGGSLTGPVLAQHKCGGRP